ncbi:winged helix-turn-helix domain-containing protein [Marinicella meishanensis]|uniref:winged helix-turn-helix domain-containing protein n=1 Tax=Marinicella meishanensis TaxID=2873263 RepID=UPI001CC0E939|nr:transcriptional regulator [Marinicella sp. NBU2979]
MKAFEFGPFLLNVETVRLYKNGAEIELEPQVFDALLLLIKHRDRVVSKDDMFNELWQGRTLTDHVITRTIYELRKVLDDKDSEQSHIRTVRGKGYQFMPPEPLTVVDQGEEASVGQASMKKWTMPLVALLTAGVILWVFRWGGSPQEPVSANQLTAHPIIAIMPIQIPADSAAVSVMSYSIIDQMVAQLGLNLNMRVIHPDSLLAWQDQWHDLWAIQQATRANFIIQGELTQYSDSRIMLGFELHKADANGQLTPFSLGQFSFPYPANSQDLKELYKQQRDTIREIIQLIKPGVTIRSDGFNETNDPEAYRMVLQAHHLMRRDSCKEILQSEQLLQKATTNDPNFAYAWFQLFAHYFKLVYVCGQSTDNYEKALAMAAKVEQLAPGKYQALTIGRNVMLTETNQVEKAYELAADADWHDPVMLNIKVYTLRYAGFLHQATQLISRIRQLDPYFYSKKPIYQAPNSLLYLNRFDEHLSLLAEPGNAYHDYYRGLNLVLSQRPDQAKPLLQAVVERTPNDLFGQFSHALFWIINEQFEAAKGLIDDMVEQRLQQQHFDGEMAYKLAQLYALAGYPEAAIKQFQAAVDHGFFAHAYFIRDPAMDAIRNHPLFAVILQQALARHLAFAEQFGLDPEIN